MSPDFFVPAVQYSVCRCNIELALIGRLLGWIIGEMAFFRGKTVLARDLHMTCCDRVVSRLMRFRKMIAFSRWRYSKIAA